MPGFAAKSFSTGPDQFKSSNDYISRKKAQTIYRSLQKDNVNVNAKNYQDPIQINGNCLDAVGGYNTDNYDLLLNVTKGKYYTEPICVSVNGTKIPSSCYSTINPNNSNCSVFSYNHDLYEGPFLQKNNTNTNTDNLCPSKIIEQYSKIDPTTTTTNSFTKLVNEDKLRNFKYPLKFRIN